jgi:hypothetical protein
MDRTPRPSLELLIVLADGPDRDRMREAITAKFRLRQMASHRVLVVEASRNDARLLRDMHGVLVASSEAVPEDQLETLSADERAWVAGWNINRAAKQRRGEGLGWDTAGFEPPDRPRGDE